MKLVVLGATGSAGASIVAHTRKNLPDWQIRGTFFSTPPFDSSPFVSYMHADLRQEADCLRAMEGCQVAVMAAAVTGGSMQLNNNPDALLTENLIMDTRCLAAAARQGVRRVLFISSATVYQKMSQAVAEDDIDLNQDPPRPYFGVGWAKRSSEKVCRFWHQRAGLEVAIFRAANLYGPYCSFDPNRSNFVPALVRKACERQDPFVVWGSPDVVRDIIYVDDFAKAVVTMLDAPDLQWGVYNLGSGRQTTVGQVVSFALRAAGHDPRQVIFDESQPVTERFRLLDCSRLRQDTDWEPLMTPEEGIQLTTSWWQENQSWWKR